MKAITTRFIGQTNHKPARVVASDMDGNRAIVPASGTLDADTHRDSAHRFAVVTLCHRMNWHGELIPAGVRDGLVWIFANTPRADWVNPDAYVPADTDLE